MKNVSVIEIIGTPNAIIQAFGISVYNKILTFVNNNEEIEIDFNGISNVTSGFCHASIGKLYSDYPVYANSKITIKGLLDNPIALEKIQYAIDLASNPEKSKLNNDMISELFN